MQPYDKVPVPKETYERLLELRHTGPTTFNSHIARVSGVSFKTIRYLMDNEGGKPIRRDSLNKLRRYLRTLLPSDEEREAQEQQLKEGEIVTS